MRSRRSGGINSMKSKSSWVLLLLLLSGIVLGGFIGEMTARVPGLSWLNFGESFGLERSARLKPRDPCDHVRTQHPDHDGEHHRRDRCDPDLPFPVGRSVFRETSVSRGMYG